MIKIILDTNVVLQHLTSRNLTFGKYIIRLIKDGDAKLFTSLETELELKIAMQYTQVKSRLNGQSAKFLAWLKYNTEVVDTVPTIELCRDPKDDKFLDLISQAKADYLITGDNDLLVLKKFETARIITPREFLELEA